ncbi:hypothetical protein TOPH_06094 [Tolypocladium ophioglossoides CBS 100239]|uniref:DUF2241 domain-containing protein n=1 Tax=Tolypocladium ophioglossoides (strain CBS 100239) TaxID=1163406 RepID=A0A0L0N5X1_TOLOC|nr:hypothetical protein TOPH_06094 [Tolypocladium ophioglossoides CBS 100239]
MAYSMSMGPTNLDAFSSIISGNRRLKGEITIEAHAAIIAAVQAGDKKRLIVKRFGISPAAIHRTLYRFEKTGQLASRPRSGRPRTKLNMIGPVAPSPEFVVEPGETRPSTLLSNLTTTLHPTTYVFASFWGPAKLPPMPQIRLFFHEPEGITIVTSLGYARAQISLNFRSSAEAAGHTAVLVARLAAMNLGVKPVSGFYHDYLLVPTEEGQPDETQLEESDRGRGQGREAQPEADQPEAEDAEEEEEEEEEAEFYGNEYDSETHQCSEVDSQDEDASGKHT